MSTQVLVHTGSTLTQATNDEKVMVLASVPGAARKARALNKRDLTCASI